MPRENEVQAAHRPLDRRAENWKTAVCLVDSGDVPRAEIGLWARKFGGISGFRKGTRWLVRRWSC